MSLTVRTAACLVARFEVTASSSRCGIWSDFRYTPALEQKMYCSMPGTASKTSSASSASRPFISYTTAAQIVRDHHRVVVPTEHKSYTSAYWTQLQHCCITDRQGYQFLNATPVKPKNTNDQTYLGNWHRQASPSRPPHLCGRRQCV